MASLARAAAAVHRVANFRTCGALALLARATAAPSCGTTAPARTLLTTAAQADGNVNVIRQEFKKQASLYSPHPNAQAFVMSEVGAVSGRALDVASGTGVFAMSLAPHCEGVVSFDATAEMQERAKRTAAAKALNNIDFALGDASELPYDDGSFDVVVSRLAVHHFANPGPIVSEMARVCKPGGRIILADIIADDDPAVHAEMDRLEILRDPSHTAMVTVQDLHELLRATGRTEVQPHSGTVYMHKVPLDWWMDNTETPPAAREEIHRAIKAEMEGGKVTGFQPFVDEEGKVTFLHRYAVAQGIRV